MGYTVYPFQDSTRALETFLKHSQDYDLIITDMTMPIMMGDVFAKNAKLIRPDIPIIMCTGFSEIMDEDKAGRLGIDAFLYKNINYNHLL